MGGGEEYSMYDDYLMLSSSAKLNGFVQAACMH